MRRWEYKTVEFNTKGFWGGKLDTEEFNNHLNSLGRDGWELISCFDTNQAEGSSRKVFAVFKREMNTL